ncbi:MAG TPA: CocE/NonD family hydrolase [Bacteroidia bacterium]|jgi:hypothetical protein|nr:CocE/NonD family hydrolase [Bacteroidia bacterium]
MTKRILSTLLLTLFLFTAAAQNKDSVWYTSNYYKKEVMISMRDGIKLFTSILIPKDTTEKHPLLLRRTPYSCMPYGEDQLQPLWRNPYYFNYVKEKYILVFQDVRGKFMSEGEAEEVRPFNRNKKNTEIDEASDAYDAVDWLVKNVPGNNGNVGVWGVSSPGFFATMAAASGHPAIKAVSPQAPVTDWFMGDDVHHNGAFFLSDNFSFYSSIGKDRTGKTKTFSKPYEFPIKDNYYFFLKKTHAEIAKLVADSCKFWNQILEHPNLDEFWKARNARIAIYNLKPAMLWVGGLFDAEDCYGAWNCYQANVTQSPATTAKLVMGPWSHGQWTGNEGSFLGNIRFGSKTSVWYVQHIELPFFNYYLKGIGEDTISKATLFFTGENKWRAFSQWPPANVNYKPIYLSQSSALRFNEETGADNNFDEYVSDPNKPVPFTEGAFQKRPNEYMNDDQRFAGKRPDVLVYQTEILEEDLTLGGPLTADLLVSITGTDADFIVKLVDVFPEDFSYPDSVKGNGKNYLMKGYQMLVRGEVMRGKYRNSFEKPEAFIPGKVTTVKYVMPDVAHTFKKGHRLMIQVQSTWFPLVDRNPQQFMNIYKAEEKDYKKATIRIYHGSNVLLPVIR